MSMRLDLENALHEAMRQKDETKRDTIRLVLSAIKLADVDTGVPIDDKGILAILQKEVKIRKETINELSGTNREELVTKARSEIKVLEKFLPAQIEDEALENLVREAIEEVSAKSISEMGKVMGVLIPKLAGKATPDRISQVVRKLLTQ